MNLELRWLRSFVAVADEMHFSRAARKLNLAQPALTAQIRQLEEAVGSTLFERTNRITGLTPVGEALLPEARTIVGQSEALRNTARRAAEGDMGTLRLGVIPPAATPGVAEALRRFIARNPGIEIHVNQGDQARLLERLEARELDLVIGRPATCARRAGVFRAQHLFTEEQGVVLRRDDPRAKLSRVPLGQLAGERLLLLRDNPHFGRMLLGHAARHDTQLLPVHTAEDFPSLHWMVRAGLGVAPCSLLLADGLPRGLVAKGLRPSPSKLEISAVWRGTDLSPCAERLLHDFRGIETGGS